MKIPLFLLNFLLLSLFVAGPSNAMKRIHEQSNQSEAQPEIQHLDILPPEQQPIPSFNYESFKANKVCDINYTLEILEKNTIESLQQVQEYLDFLINSGVAPNEIALVLDLDGTLTTEDTPSNLHIKFLTVKERDSSTTFVKKYVNSGMNVIVSSAWNNLLATVKKLELLGLKETLGVYNSVEELNNTPSDWNGFKVLCAGNVVSVRKENIFDKYYRCKAFSIKLAYPEINVNQIKHVIFVDDSGGNVQLFAQDIGDNRIGLNADVDVVLFNLLPIRKG
jgi:hypothetical protein